MVHVLLCHEVHQYYALQHLVIFVELAVVVSKIIPSSPQKGIYCVSIDTAVPFVLKKLRHQETHAAVGLFVRARPRMLGAIIIVRQ